MSYIKLKIFILKTKPRRGQYYQNFGTIKNVDQKIYVFVFLCGWLLLYRNDPVMGRCLSLSLKWPQNVKFSYMILLCDENFPSRAALRIQMQVDFWMALKWKTPVV